MRRIRRLLLINAVATVALFLAVDLAISHSNIKYRILPDVFAIQDQRLNHSFAPNVSHAYAIWGRQRYYFYSNSLGFRDSSVRRVEPISAKPHRIVFIGDSFTEGIGMPWGDSFVGLFAAAYPNVEVLNGGVRSYSPSIYLEEIRRLLDAGIKFDHVAVYIDISDIQDEAAAYVTDSAGNIVDYKDHPDFGAHVGDPSVQTVAQPGQYPPLLQFFRNHFLLSRYIVTRLYNLYVLKTSKRILSGRYAQLGLLRSSWTVHGDLPLGYGEMGVSGGVQKAMLNMTALTQLLRERNIKFSVGVYPWPDQVMFDTSESVGMTIWRDWCKSQGCALFINHFPDFFPSDRAAEDNSAVLDKYYIPGDVHFNEDGNKLIAARLINAFRDELK
jgi:lysophospholipase L1-like esterase